MNSLCRVFCVLSIVLIARCGSAAPLSGDEAYADSIKALLRKNFEGKDFGMVVGIVDANGSRVFSAGRLGNGTDDVVNGNTVFEIGSVTKTFTDLLLLEMVERGQLKLSDAVATHLPDTVTMPSKDGKQITLFNLAAQNSGLPFNADNHTGTEWSERFSSYTVPKMYEFLASYKLMQEPGEKFQYSNIGMGLLGHVMARKAGQDFESLVVERICRPLNMDSTGIRLTPDLQARLAMGHDEAGKSEDHYEMPAIAGAGGMRSTVNDLLKFAAAEAGLNQNVLTPLMEKSHQICHADAQVRDQFVGRSAIPWFDEGVYMPAGSDLLGHSGGRCGTNSFVGFDLKQRVGVVVLTNQSKIHSSMLGWRILQHARLENLDAEKMRPLRDVVGIGAMLDMDNKTQELRITGAVPDSPADKAGLGGGLVVQSIDGVDIKGKSLVDCLTLFRGPAGSIIRLELVDQEGKSKTVELTRQRYRMDS